MDCNIFGFLSQNLSMCMKKLEISCLNRSFTNSLAALSFSLLLVVLEIENYLGCSVKI